VIAMVMAMLKMRAVGDQGVSKRLAGKKGGARSRSCPWASKTRGIQNAAQGVQTERRSKRKRSGRRCGGLMPVWGATQQMWHAI
jgi:hypothetical protein